MYERMLERQTPPTYEDMILTIKTPLNPMHRTFLLIWRIYCPSTMTFSSSATADPI